MKPEEYIDLFHKAQINLVAFKPVFHCDDELRRMVEMAVEAEREACAKSLEDSAETATNFQAKVLIEWCATHIRARGKA
jgi:hypothetical protein